jgi:hypothetical protein
VLSPEALGNRNPSNSDALDSRPSPRLVEWFGLRTGRRYVTYLGDQPTFQNRMQQVAGIRPWIVGSAHGFLAPDVSGHLE